MGVSHVTLEPGAWSSQRHWHDREDEFVVMLSGEAILVDDAGETMLHAGDCLAFPAGDRSGHHLQNRSPEPCVFIAVSAGPADDSGDYPDIDMRFTPDGYFRKDGTAYDAARTK
jgi:uncharacterized cupin superfamily protein